MEWGYCAYKIHDLLERSNVWIRGVPEEKKRKIKSKIVI